MLGVYIGRCDPAADMPMLRYAPGGVFIRERVDDNDNGEDEHQTSISFLLKSLPPLTDSYNS